jgi:hypothetical protein
MSAQYYVFSLNGSAYVEGFDDLGHWAAPSPYTSVERAVAALKVQHPTAVVDTVCDPSDISEASALALQF